jgi:hypothetical protein
MVLIAGKSDRVTNENNASRANGNALYVLTCHTKHCLPCTAKRQTFIDSGQEAAGAGSRDLRPKRFHRGPEEREDGTDPWHRAGFPGDEDTGRSSSLNVQRFDGYMDEGSTKGCELNLSPQDGQWILLDSDERSSKSATLPISLPSSSARLRISHIKGPLSGHPSHTPSRIHERRSSLSISCNRSRRRSVVFQVSELFRWPS